MTMTYLDTLLARATGRKAAPPAPPARLRITADSYSQPSADSVSRQAQLYASLAWMQTAVESVASVVATAPFYVQQMSTSGLETVVNHEFELLLRRPNPLMSRFEFLEATYAWRRITGNCYWWLNRPTPEAPPVELWIIPSGQMAPVPDGTGGVRGYLYDTGQGAPLALDATEIVHFKTFNPLDRYVGLSAVQALALDASADIAAQRYNVAFYDKDNAKPDGLLLFAENIEDGRWGRLQADLRDQSGGTKRKRMMLLRNVGPGGVQWVMTHISRADMQYLEQRTFTKEEIFGRLAPGLASILAVNATEANSAAGKDTFLSMAVFPALVSMAEKIANDILPAYGEDLTGAFDDVRRADTAMELQQQAAYAATHTIDEVRARYYDDPPLGDERGAMLASDRLAVPAAAPAPLVDPAVALLEAGKALDRRRWRDKALKAVASGRATTEVPFTPEYLSDDEAMAIRAALRRADGPAAIAQAIMEAV